jgi:hypothetical protein
MYTKRKYTFFFKEEESIFRFYYAVVFGVYLSVNSKLFQSKKKIFYILIYLIFIVKFNY